MQPNLNKAQAKKARFVLEDKFIKDISPLEKRLFDRKISVAYLKMCSDTYFHDDQPVSVNIEVRTKKRLLTYEKHNKFVTKMPLINEVSSSLLRALTGCAYDNIRQVAELYVTKIHGNEDRIVVEIERI